jgi:hypothetical protein
MRDNHVPRRQAGTQLPNNMIKRLVVRDKNLHIIAHLRQLGWSPHEIRDRPRRAIPHKNVETLPPQNIADPASNNAQTDNSDVFTCAL